jgi:hypothetical protein
MRPDGSRPARAARATTRRRALLAALALLALAASPAPAATVTEWRDAGVAVPAEVDLYAVATDGASVIAVGTQHTPGAADEVVVYRRVDGAWQRDLPLPPPPPFVPEPVIDPETGEPVIDPETGEPVMTEPPPDPPKTYGRLVDVAIGGGTAWAIGTAPVDPAAADGAQRPLILRNEATGWTEVTAPSEMGLPTTLALNGDDGFVGDASGKVFELVDHTLADAPLTPAGLVPPPATQVNGLALTGAGEAIGVAAPADSWSGFLTADGTNDEVRQEVAEAIPAGVQPLAVGAAGTLAVAVDGDGPCRDSAPGAAPGLWTRDVSLGVWRRTVPGASSTGTRWCDLALSGTTLVLAGDRATATGRVGSIWRREGTGTLRLEDDLDARALHAVAVSAAEAWAVGEDGALWRRAEWPVPPPPDDGNDGDDGDKDDGDDGGSTGEDGADEPPAAAAPVEDPAPAPAPQTVVAQLAPNGSVVRTTPRRPRAQPPAKPAQQLLVGLKARRTGRRLVLSFRLRARARVLVTALRGKRVVGRLRSRALRPGARRLVVTFRGRKPPTELKIVVRPVGGPGANKEGKGS